MKPPRKTAPPPRGPATAIAPTSCVTIANAVSPTHCGMLPDPRLKVSRSVRAVVGSSTRLISAALGTSEPPGCWTYPVVIRLSE